MSDPWEDPEVQQWAQTVIDELVPKIRSSAMAMTVYTGSADVKLAVELGFSMLLDKPLIVAVTPGATVPPKVMAVADEIVEVDLGNPAHQQRIADAVGRLQEKGLIK
jgi:hypothetical protein